MTRHRQFMHKTTSTGARVAPLILAFMVAAVAEPAGAQDGAVGEALGRPALAARAPARAVLHGAATAGTRLVAVGERGIIVLSDDGGTSWRQAPVPVSVTLTAVCFADAKHGIAVGHAGVVLVTADGGETWTRRLDGRRIAEIEIAAAQARGDAAALKAAERLRDDGPDKPLLDLLVFDARRAIVVGAYGMALATGDGGQTWTSWRDRLDNPRERHLYAIRHRGQRIVIAGEQGVVLQSLDSGAHFSRLVLPYAGSFFTLELPADKVILVAGLRGNAWRSDDAGAHWQALTSPVPASFTASALRADGSVLLANQAGMLLTAVPASDALLPLPSLSANTLPSLNAVLPLPDDRVLALSMQGLLLPGATPAK